MPWHNGQSKPGWARVNDLTRVATRQCGARESNPRPADCKSSTLTTALHLLHLFINLFCYLCGERYVFIAVACLFVCKNYLIDFHKIDEKVIDGPRKKLLECGDSPCHVLQGWG